MNHPLNYKNISKNNNKLFHRCLKAKKKCRQINARNIAKQQELTKLTSSHQGKKLMAKWNKNTRGRDILTGEQLYKWNQEEDYEGLCER